eukprot:CAMPEP_0197465518 /NCGR_PEP_ID=MMETSP1175-20131217/64580_1 /TAXON_ID=1003142 /ORGANISM="Triceratium dubium, Strain CCMP147" /LENGTH=917 /DNA_ID=CAMNT_0043001535 /DNA_START=549 /DNA_END=3302 /DNA_ORIENTATION=-
MSISDLSLKKPHALVVLLLLGLQVVDSDEASCGEGTIFDGTSDTCVCDNASCNTSSSPTSHAEAYGLVYVAGLFDTVNFDWGRELFDFTVGLINDKTDGWFDDILDDGTTLVTVVEDAGCDPKVALPAYWDLKTEWGHPLHGVVGCRCSSASTAVARVAALEGVPVVSPASSSARLSDAEEFSSFFRLVGPDDERGQVGGLINLLRTMGWDRVTVLQTDTAYTSDLATSFGNAWVGYHESDETTGATSWTGEVAYSHTIGLNADGSLDEDSARTALASVPTSEPRINSRVIVLLAHDQHAYPLLRLAQESNFQPDTIWVGTAAWAGRTPPQEQGLLPTGYIGLEPFRNQDAVYQDFLERLQGEQAIQGREVMSELPDYAAETMHDSLIALTMALSRVKPEDRDNGEKVLSALRDVSFSGLSGPVSFTAEGDRANPRYGIVNWQNGEWKEVGEASPNLNGTSVRLSEICWAESGCGLPAAPSEKYPVPPPKLPVWVWVVIPVCIVVAMALGFRYWRSHKKKNMLKEEMKQMKGIDSELADLEEKVKQAKKRQASLIQQRAGLQETPSTWSDSTEMLVEVFPDNDEYWDVCGKLRETMDDAWITKVWRIQNHPLWNYYNFHKNRLSTNGIDHNERSVWHGTSSLDPGIIYNDQQDGFMMQFSQRGFWGRGIYFALKSSYSHSYSFRPRGSAPTERPEGSGDEREMFLAKLLVGNEIMMDRDKSSSAAAECRDLTVPPTDPATNQKYNTVTGYTAGSQVWIVYENGRAYPDYLVRYYRGSRNHKKTPFETKEEAMKAKEVQPEQPVAAGRSWSWFRDDAAADQAEQGLSSSVTFTKGSGAPSDAAVWEYLDATGKWKRYDAASQGKIENVYQQFSAGSSPVSTLQIKSGEWRYEIDVDSMKQTNIEHSNRTKRKIRRRQV